MPNDRPTRIAQAARKFAASLKGRVILRGDTQYSKARRVWNHAVNAFPEVIVRCANVDDIVRAIEFSRQHDLAAAVRSGGHSFAGHGVSNGGLVIDLSPMKRVEIDPCRLSASIEPGVLAGELDCITQAFEMAVPLGSCPSVGVAGYSLGGGEGSLTPKFGYGCDSLTRVDIITADGRLRSASKHENPDLFWAVRGAGANFGVVTKLEFQLHPIKTVLSGHLKYPMRQARKVLTFLANYAPTIPDELFLIAAVLPYPGERMLDLAMVWPGDEKDGQRALLPLRRFLRPLEDTIKVNAYLDEQRAGTGTPGGGEYSSHRRSGHLHKLTEDLIDVIVEYTSIAPSEASGITMIYWHGPWCSGSHDNAFGFRRTGFEYWVHTYWKKAHERRRASAWVDQFFASLVPLSTGAVYVNGLENEGSARVQAAYGDHYGRLSQLKRKYDPDNFFRLNQNICPTA
jgi:FAD binding domain-containing protein/berberine-like enzyme